MTPDWLESPKNKKASPSSLELAQGIRSVQGYFGGSFSLFLSLFFFLMISAWVLKACAKDLISLATNV